MRQFSCEPRARSTVSRAVLRQRLQQKAKYWKASQTGPRGLFLGPKKGFRQTEQTRIVYRRSCRKVILPGRDYHQELLQQESNSLPITTAPAAGRDSRPGRTMGVKKLRNDCFQHGKITLGGLDNCTQLLSLKRKTITRQISNKQRSSSYYILS